MNILIKEIPESGKDISLEAVKEGWFRQILKEALGELHHEGENGKAVFHLLRTGQNVDCRGEVSCDLHPTCCRCLKDFPLHLEVPIHLTLAPLFENERQLKIEGEDEVELVKEDLEFAFYEGDTFNLGDLIREQVILTVPMQPLCSKECKGLCQSCGQDLNDGPCQCKEEHVEHRWDALRGVKLKRQARH